MLESTADEKDYSTLPLKGMPKDELLSLLATWGEAQYKRYGSGKVRVQLPNSTPRSTRLLLPDLSD